jgi:toxin ParE1/3/4
LRVQISSQANADLDRLVQDGLRHFGRPQTERYLEGVYRAFGLLAEFPYANREHTEFKPPLRVHPHERHLIFYLVKDEMLFILRVRHSREDWQADT